MTSHSTIHLIDASPYIFRAYFSVPGSIRAADGSAANAVHGYTSFLVKYIEQEQPSHLAVAFDESLTTSFRNEIYPAYKAQRELPPLELEAQLQACQEVTAALGAHGLVSERYEADDLIGSLCHRLEPRGHTIVVVSPDKDLAQLVNDRVTLYDFARETRYTPAAVKDKFGVTPTQIPDLLGLAGDSVDNIPGVKGVGAKTAAALLAAFPDIETLYGRLDEVLALPLRGAASVRKKLEQDRDLAALSKRLAQVALDAPVPHNAQDLRYSGPAPALLEPLVERLGFRALRETLERCQR